MIPLSDKLIQVLERHGREQEVDVVVNSGLSELPQFLCPSAKNPDGKFRFFEEMNH